MNTIEQTPMITFACGGCGRPFTVPAAFAGRRATCKACGNKVVVPGEPVSAQRDSGSGAPSSNGERRSGPPLVEAPARTPAVTMKLPESTFSQAVHRSDQISVISEAQAPPTASHLTITLDEPPPQHALPTAPGAPEAATDRPASPAGVSKAPVRVRRLMVDAEQMAKTFSGDGPIRLKSAIGDPPDLYQIEYRVKGLQRGWRGKPKSRTEHLVEIQLTSEYPRLSPKCRMLTPIFHPNMDETTICIGDHWTAGARLVDLVIQIGEMIAYQAYNIRSPLDGEAAMWADLNPGKLPTDATNLHPGEND